jgi:hypothetical protein
MPRKAILDLRLTPDVAMMVHHQIHDMIALEVDAHLRYSSFHAVREENLNERSVI